MTTPSIAPKLVTVKYIGPLNGILVNNSIVTLSTVVDCGQRDVTLEVTPPTINPNNTTINYTWTLPSTWTLLAQGGTGGGQSNKVTVRTDILNGGTVKVVARRSDATTTTCAPEFSIAVARPTPVVPAYTSFAGTICTSSYANYTVTSSGATSYDWEVTNGLTINGATSAYGAGASVSVDAPASGGYSGTIRVRATRGQCGNSDWLERSVFIGNQATGNGYVVNGPANPNIYDTNLYSLSAAPAGASSYQWEIPQGNGWEFYSVNTTVRQVYITAGTTPGYVRVSWQNQCGFQPNAFLHVTPQSGGGGGNPLRVFPNPASDQITVEYAVSESKKTFEIKIFNSMGMPVKSAGGKSKKTDIGTSDLPEGLYVLQVSDDNAIHSQRIKISR